MIRWFVGSCVFLIALCSAPLTAQEPNWTLNLPTDVPAPRVGYAMTYDAGRGQVILFGGYGQKLILQDTWVWDGTSWTQKRPLHSPPPVCGHSMVYDAARDQVVLFGGSYPNETWVWNGTDWTKKSPSISPSPRIAQVMAYDAAHGQVLLYGGWNDAGTFFDETWIWDGINWTQKSPANNPPAAALRKAMTYDTARGQVVLLAGKYGPLNEWHNETWVWDGTNWTKKSPATSPAGSRESMIAYDSARGQVVLVDGVCGQDTWVWDGTNWTQKSPASSPIVCGSRQMAFDASHGQMVMFVGSRTAGFNETWIWDGTNWTKQILTNDPPERANCAMAYDEAHSQVVLFGGQNGTGSLNDTWVWDGAAWTKKNPANSPPARDGYAMTYDAARGHVVLFGGLSNYVYRNDTWVWDGTNWTQKNPTNGPTARTEHAMAYDAARGQVVLFGGEGESGYLNDTWIWDGTNWTQKNPITNPTIRSEHAMAYDAARGQMVLFGGRGSGIDYRTWVWDGSNWTLKAPGNNPLGRTGHAMVYDTTRGQVLMFGETSYHDNDTWVWDGTNWTQKNPINSPTIRHGHGMAYDAVRGQVVLFGGLTHGWVAAGLLGYDNQTWIWPTVLLGPRVEITVSTNGTPMTLTVDGTVMPSPQTFYWVAGSAHSISVATPLPGSVSRWAFAGWSDGGPQSHTIITPATATTFTADVRFQFLLTTATNPGTGVSITANPASPDGYYDHYTRVQLTAAPASLFTYFSGYLKGSTNPQTLDMLGPLSVTANFIYGTGPNVPPYALELSPFQGAGATQIFTGKFYDANGWTNIAKAALFFHESYAGTAGSCLVEVRPPEDRIAIIDDAGVNFAYTVPLGSNSVVQNKACSVDAAKSSFSGSGNELTVNVAVTFKPAFGSAGGREPRKAICQWAKDTAGAGEDQSCFGLWVPEAPSPLKISRYRLYNPVNYAHFFTASQNERDVLVSRGLTPEDPPPGMGYNQPTTVSGIPTQPFYRILFFPSNGAPIFHYWTRDREEYKAAVRLRSANLGEGIDSFLLSGQVPGTFATLRLRFTASPSPFPIYHYALQPEHDALLGMGWGVSLGVDGYLQPFVANDQAGTVKGLSARVDKRISAVLSAASHESGPVAPGQLVRVYLRDLSKFAQAFVDGSAVPLTTIADKYVELAIPESVAGKEAIEIAVDDLGVRAEGVTVPLAAARPAVFVKAFIGRGHIDALPSAAGTVTLQVTGVGELELGQPKLPLSVRLNGYPAEILSISTIDGQPGRLAVNVKLPAEVLAGDADVATVSLQAGAAHAQPGLLVRVR